MSCTTCGSPQPATCGHCGIASALWTSCNRAGCQNRKDAEPRVPRHPPEKRCACGRTSPGWCQAIMCDRRPVTSEANAAEPTARDVGARFRLRTGAPDDLGPAFRITVSAAEHAAPAEVSLGAAPQILDLVEFGFTFSEAAGLPDAERDLYVQLVKERARARDPSRVRDAAPGPGWRA